MWEDLCVLYTNYMAFHPRNLSTSLEVILDPTIDW